METLQRTANRGSVSTGVYEVGNSAVFEADDSSYIRFTNISTYYSSARAKKFSNSIWVKRSALDHRGMVLSYSQNGYLEFNANHELNWIMAFRSGSSGSGTQKTLKSNAVFRDTAAWYHIMVAVDTAQSTASDRVKIYVNGVQITSWATEQYPDQNDESANVYEQHNYIGTWGGGDHTNTGFNGYAAEFYFLSEIAASPTDFGKFDSDTGIWIPKLYTGTITSPSSYLNFSNASNLAEATSGQDWASGNVQNVKQATDTCTNNFCTLNNNFRHANNTTSTDGGTYMPNDGNNYNAGYSGTIGVTKGKWYYEAYINSRNSTYGLTIAIGWHNFKGNHISSGSANYLFGTTGGEDCALWYLHGGDFYTFNNGSRANDSNIAGLGSSQVGDWIGVALDLDANTISYTVEGSAVSNGSDLDIQDVGDAAAAGEHMLPCLSVYNNNFTVNFGGYCAQAISSSNSDANGYGSFEFPVPSGYYAICTKNLAEFG